MLGTTVTSTPPTALLPSAPSAPAPARRPGQQSRRRGRRSQRSRGRRSRWRARRKRRRARCQPPTAAAAPVAASTRAATSVAARGAAPAAAPAAARRPALVPSLAARRTSLEAFFQARLQRSASSAARLLRPEVRLQLERRADRSAERQSRAVEFQLLAAAASAPRPHGPPGAPPRPLGIPLGRHRRRRAPALALPSILEESPASPRAPHTRAFGRPMPTPSQAAEPSAAAARLLAVERANAAWFAASSAAADAPLHELAAQCMPAPAPLHTVPAAAQAFRAFLATATADKQLVSPGHLRKLANSAILDAQALASAAAARARGLPDPPPPLHRCDGNDARDMAADPSFFQCGAVPLPPSEIHLPADNWLACHLQHCALCGPAGALHDSCYFVPLYQVLRKGWKVPVASSAVAPQYDSTGNSPAVDCYAASHRTAIQKQAAFGAIQPVPEPAFAAGEAPPPPPFGCVVSPSGAVLKSSDRARALALTGITLTDQQSLDAANEQLAARGFPKVKIRPVVNLTQSGVNAAAAPRPFSYPSVDDAIAMLTPAAGWESATSPVFSGTSWSPLRAVTCSTPACGARFGAWPRSLSGSR